MSGQFQLKRFNLNIETHELVDTDGNRLSRFYLYRANQALFKVQLVDNNNDPFPLEDNGLDRNGGNTFVFGMDSSFIADHPEMVISSNDDFNLAVDWDEIDLATGKICFRIDLNTTELKTYLATSAQKAIYAALWIIPPGGKPFLVSHWSFAVYNVAVEVGEATPAVIDDYATLEFVTNTCAPLIPANGTYRIKDSTKFQLKNITTDTFHTIVIEGVSGTEHFRILEGEA